MGQKSATYDAQGNIIGFYDSVDSPPIPAGVASIEITEAQWQTCLANPGYTVHAGELVPPVPLTDAQLLETAQSMQIAKLSNSCQAAIYAGFQSSALGSAYSYPFKTEDQTNLAASVLLSTLPVAQTIGWTVNFWCADSAGAWLMRPHTVAQIQQVGIDADIAKMNNINKNIVLAGQVAAATTISAVQAIAWN